MESVRVTTAEELGKAIKNNVESIEIEGDLTSKVIRIKATGKVAWAVAIGGIAVSVAAIICAPSTAGASTVAGIIASPVAIGVLGVSATCTAIAIAVATGGIAGLNMLRKYKIVSREGNKLVLKK